MAGDIRNFFGGPKGAPGPVKKVEEKPAPKGRGRPKKVISDDEEELVEPQPKKAAPLKKKPDPVKEEEVTSSAYFADKKSKKSNGPVTTPKKSAATTNGTPATGRRSARKNAKATYAEDSDDNMNKLDDSKDGGGDDIHAEDYRNGRRGDDYEESDDDLPVKPVKKPNSKKPKVEDEDEEIEQAPPMTGAGSDKKSARKRKKDDSEEEEETPKKKVKKATPRKPAAKKTAEPDNSAAQKIIDSIETVRAPTPPPRDGDRKFVFGGGNAAVVPAEAMTDELPEGAENCLAGMSFVFTGVLRSLGREEGQSLVKKHGGKVTTAPSSKTTFVVLGSEAGPKKLETIRNMSLKTIDQDGLFDLIRKMPANGGDGKVAAAHAEKKAKAEEKMKDEAAEMERREKERIKQQEKDEKAKAAARGLEAPVKSKLPKVDDRLWVDKYAPDSMQSVCGNKGLVEKLQNWLRQWPKRAKFNFKQAGPDGTGIFRAAMLHGPPGIGKTTAAHLVAKLEGYDVIESNASDTRSKKLVEGGLRGVLDATSLLGYFAADGKKVDPTKQKILLIMDEVDGMSAGDRGGVGALAAVAKKTNVPMILICNDRRLPKMKPFDFVTADFGFRRPTTDMVRSRIMTICYREGLKLPTSVIDAIIEGSHADIRQIINMISTIKIDQKQLDHAEGKAMSKAWEKHVILKPWDIVGKILRAEMFSPSSTATLNDKIELYFNDHEFSYLMLQENYLKANMSRANGYNGKERNLKLLELAEGAAASISDGDLVDRMIHGSQQQWSLMPTHAAFSFVRPASYVYGNIGGQVGFTSWLGNNSKQGKLSRYVKEIQGHMRLRASGDRHEVRQQYLPAIWERTVGTMAREGKESAQSVIDFMDSYYLTKDDYDAILELGLGPQDQEGVKLDTQTKATFTRLYNSQNHPMPFIKATALNASAKVGGGAKRDKPDLEEAVDESEGEEEIVDVADDDDEDGEIDLKKDKYIKAPKKKAAPKKGKGKDATNETKGKGKGKKAKDDEEDEESEEDEKPKKGAAAGRGRGGGAGRGRGRGR